MNDNNYVWGGAVAGLVVIAFLGALLARNSPRLRAALVPYLGEAPARWAVYVAWFAYVYSTLNALGQASSILPALAPGARTPPVLAFFYGSVWHALLTFVNALVPLLHTAALLTAAFVLHRHLKARTA